jgi:hypothetical protein
MYFLHVPAHSLFLGSCLKSGQNVTLVTSSHSSRDNFLVTAVAAAKVEAKFSWADFTLEKLSLALIDCELAHMITSFGDLAAADSRLGR